MPYLVSVITPCFEHEKYIEDYFESLLAQTYRHVEIILYDDASKDRSWAMAQGYQQRLQDRFSRVVLRRNEHNLGLLETMQRLMSEVRGDIVCVLDSDDSLYPEKIEENVSFLDQHPDVGLVHGDADFLFEDEDRLVRSYWRSKGGRVPEGEAFDQLLHENCILGCTAAYRTSLVEAHVDFQSYRDRGYRSADYPMALDLSLRAPVGYIDRSLAVYRVRRDSISHPGDEIDHLQWRLNYLSIKLDYGREYGWSDETRDRAEAQFHRCLRRLGWASGSAETFAQGDSWLLQHNPRRSGGRKQKMRRIAIKNRALWRGIRWLEALTTRSAATGGILNGRWT